MNNVEVIEENEINRLERLEELGLTEEKINENKKSITKVDAEKADELGKKLVSKIGSKDYNEDKELDDIIKLIKDGANLNYLSNNHNSALLLCARKGYLETFITLLKFGADINQHNDRLTTPLMSAARHGEKEILSIAILVGADINARCFDGDTALMSAKRHGQTLCYLELIRANAIISVKNHLNQTCRAIQNMDGEENIEDEEFYAEEEYIPYKDIASQVLSEALDDARMSLHELTINYNLHK